MDYKRTPDECFANLPGYDFTPHYAEVNGLRMHYVDEGQGDPILCLHGEPSWSYLYRKMIPILRDKGRVIAPDLIGFGKSDKPTAREAYTYDMHHQSLVALIEQLDLKRVTLVCQDWGGLLGLPIAALMEDRFARLVIMNTFLPTGEESMPDAFIQWRDFSQRSDDMPIGGVIQMGTYAEVPDDVLAAYDAPFPDKTYKVGALQFPVLVPTSTDHPTSAPQKEARERLSKWEKPALVMFSDEDPITGPAAPILRAMIPSAENEPLVTITQAGHFLQEDRGEEIARQINDFIDRRPI